MSTLNIVIPSRSQPKQADFLGRAIASIRKQQNYGHLTVRIVVGVDKGRMLAPDLISRLGITVVESHGKSQAAALNAAIQDLDGDYLAFLEDDDRWEPHFLEVAMEGISRAPFVSSTQLDIVDPVGPVVGINDFPTPSGWFMRQSVWRTVGKFDENYKWHLDNEWLGRLGDAPFRRLHMIELTAPESIDRMVRMRPWLANVARFGGNSVGFHRHKYAIPQVLRAIHSGSGMSQIQLDEAKGRESSEEYERIRQRFGRIPW